jgi:hypothetical protein
MPRCRERTERLWAAVSRDPFGVGMTAASDPEVFAQAWWLRGMNVVAAFALALLCVAGLMSSVRATTLAVVLSLVITAAGLWIGIRAALSCVTLSPVALHYRGIFRSWAIPTAGVLALVEGGVGPLAVLTNRNGPSLSWRDEDGGIRRITLACLPSARQSAIGSDATQEISNDLRLALDPHIRRNL